MNTIISLFSIEDIMRLEWFVKGPGIVIIGMLLWRAIRALFSIQPISFLTSILYAAIAAFALSRFGIVIQNIIQTQIGL